MDWLSDNAGMIGLLFFFAVFVGIAVWTYLPRHRKKLEEHKEIPLKENGDDGAQ